MNIAQYIHITVNNTSLNENQTCNKMVTVQELLLLFYQVIRLNCNSLKFYRIQLQLSENISLWDNCTWLTWWMIPLPGFQNPTPYLALTVDRNSYTSLLISCQKCNISTVNTYISHIRWMASSTQYQPKLSPVCNTCNLSLLITRLKKKCFSRFGRLIYKQWCTGLATSEFRPAESHLAITLQHTCILSDLTLVYHYLQYEGKIIFFYSRG